MHLHLCVCVCVCVHDTRGLCSKIDVSMNMKEAVIGQKWSCSRYCDLLGCPQKERKKKREWEQSERKKVSLRRYYPPLLS